MKNMKRDLDKSQSPQRRYE